MLIYRLTMLPTKGLTSEELEAFKKKAAELGFTITPVDEKKEQATPAAKPTGADDKGKDKPKKAKKYDDEEYNPLRGSGFYATKEVGFTKTFGETLTNTIKVREFNDIDVDGAVVLAGFPSTSLASILTGGYLREQLKLPLVGVISSGGFAPRCIIERGVPSHR